MENPSISVIIPLYNAEDYIGACLDSLLSQTFQNFEVIVVNDSSTDKSAEIVAGYKEKFSDRFKFIATEKNSGNSGTPRNIGLNFASGEYVFFLDADDYLKETSLNTLYTAAKEHEANVVYTSAYYNLSSSEEFKIFRDAKAKKMQKRDAYNNADLIVNEPDKNLSGLFSGEDFRTAWTKFVQRDLLKKNEIFFPDIPVGNDYIWSMNVAYHANKLLRFDVPLYVRRSYSPGLVARKTGKAANKVAFWVSSFVAWLKAFNQLIGKNDLLHNNFSQYFKIASEYFKYCLNNISDEIVDRFYSRETHDILLREFAKSKDPAFSMVPFLFSMITNREKAIKRTQKNFDDLKANSQKEFDDLNTKTKNICRQSAWIRFIR